MKPMQKYVKQYQGMGISVGLILVAVAALVFGIIPTAKKIIEIREKTVTLRKKSAQFKVKIGILESLDEETYASYLKELALAVPTDKAITSLFTTIDGLSALSGVTLSDFTLTKPGSIATESAKRLSNEERKVGSLFLPFTLTVTGTYDQIYKFIEQSIAVRRFFRVRFFDLSFDKSEVISTHMGMDAYYSPLPTELGSAEQPLEQLTETDERTIAKVANLPLLGTDQAPVQTGEPQTVVIGPPKDDPFSP